MRKLFLVLFLCIIAFCTIFSEDPGKAGSLIWSFDSGSFIISSPSVISDSVYFGNSANQVFNLNAADGKPFWSYKTDISGNKILSSPLVINEKLYIGGNKNKKLIILDSLTGEKYREVNTSGEIESSPHEWGGKIYYGSWDKKIYCYDEFTETNLWEFDTKGMVRSSPLIINGRVYIGSFDKKFYCLDAVSGKKIWEFSVNGEIQSTASGNEDYVYFGCKDRIFYCLDAKNGTKVWEYKTGDIIVSSPFLSDGKVFFGSYDDKMYCLDEISGEKLWEFKADNNIQSSPVVADGKVYFGSHDKKFYCIDEENGKKIWDFGTRNIIESSPCLVDGKIYFGSDDGKLYCIDSGSRGIYAGNSLDGQSYSILKETKTNTNAGKLSANESSLSNINETVQPLKTELQVETAKPEIIVVSNFVTNYISLTNIVQIAATNYITNFISNIQTNTIKPAVSYDLYNYTIQTGAFTNNKNAFVLYEKLRKSGYAVYQMEITVNKKKYTRIRLGKYDMIEKALKVRQELEKKGIRSILVRTIR